MTAAPSPTPPVPRRPGRAGGVHPAGLACALLAYAAVSDLLLGDGGYVVRNLAATGLLLLLAHRGGLTTRELGLARGREGASLGAALAAVVMLGLVVAVALGDRLGPLALLLRDERAALAGPALAWVALVRIPLGTVLFEEVAFRGVLDASARRRWPPARALATSAVVFGLYHVPPTAVALRLNDVAPTSTAGLATIGGAVVVTTVAGAVFSWARARSGSLLAPVLLHLATNVGGLLAATSVQRGLTT